MVLGLQSVGDLEASHAFQLCLLDIAAVVSCLVLADILRFRRAHGLFTGPCECLNLKLVLTASLYIPAVTALARPRDLCERSPVQKECPVMLVIGLNCILHSHCSEKSQMLHMSLK
jgi:hypothetical protein